MCRARIDTLVHETQPMFYSIKLTTAASTVNQLYVMFLFFFLQLHLQTAAYFEKDEYDKCIKDCELAVEQGREHKAEFKIIAR